MELQGTLIEKRPVFKGTGARGDWVKQEFILETQESGYPRKVCLSVFGEDRVKELDTLQIGETVKASVNIESREYNGRWYTDVRALRLEKGQINPASPEYPAPGPIMTEQDEGEDDLPF